MRFSAASPLVPLSSPTPTKSVGKMAVRELSSRTCWHYNQHNSQVYHAHTLLPPPPRPPPRCYIYYHQQGYAGSPETGCIWYQSTHRFAPLPSAPCPNPPDRDTLRGNKKCWAPARQGKHESARRLHQPDSSPQSPGPRTAVVFWCMPAQPYLRRQATFIQPPTQYYRGGEPPTTTTQLTLALQHTRWQFRVSSSAARDKPTAAMGRRISSPKKLRSGFAFAIPVTNVPFAQPARYAFRFRARGISRQISGGGSGVRSDAGMRHEYVARCARLSSGRQRAAAALRTHFILAETALINVSEEASLFCHMVCRQRLETLRNFGTSAGQVE